MKPRDWLKFIVLGIIWGTSFLWIKIAVEDIGPFFLVLFRIGFAFLFVLFYILIRRIRISWSWRKLGLFAFLGFFNMAFPFILISWAETVIPSGLASILNSTVPLFTMILAAIFLPDEKPTWHKVIGVIIGFTGVAILTSGSSGQEQGNVLLPGIIVMLVAAVSYAAAVVFARKLTRQMRSEEQALGQLITGLGFISLATACVEPALKMPSHPITWVAVVWLGLLGSGTATLLYYSLLNSVGATKATLVSYVFPIIAVILGVIFLKEEPTWQMIMGAVLVIGGVIWVNTLEAKRKPAIAPESEKSIDRIE